jgi:hypothetical protein
LGAKYGSQVASAHGLGAKVCPGHTGGLRRGLSREGLAGPHSGGPPGLPSGRNYWLAGLPSRAAVIAAAA